jgi:hypothetical protein
MDGAASVDCNAMVQTCGRGLAREINPRGADTGGLINDGVVSLLDLRTAARS